MISIQLPTVESKARMIEIYDPRLLNLRQRHPRILSA